MDNASVWIVTCGKLVGVLMGSDHNLDRNDNLCLVSIVWCCPSAGRLFHSNLPLNDHLPYSMDIHARYASKFECFDRTLQKATEILEDAISNLIREELGQIPVAAKDRLEWEYVIRANIWDHIVC